MNLHDDNLPKNPKHIPDKINLIGDAVSFNEKTTALITEALAKGPNSDTQIFSQFEKLLADHKANTIAHHDENGRNKPHRK